MSEARIANIQPKDMPQGPARGVRISMRDLIEAYKEPGRPNYRSLLSRYEDDQGCEVREEYFGNFIFAGAIRVYDKADKRHNIRLAYNSALAEPRFAEVLRKLRLEERESAILLQGKSQDILVQTIFGVVAYLLTVLDWTNEPQTQDKPEIREQRLAAAVKSAANEIRPIRASLTAATRRKSLTEYAAGLPIGVTAAAIIVAAVLLARIRIDPPSSSAGLATCLAAGAVGGAVSVMARITGGQGVFVVSTQGRAMTLLAGALRPIVGAIFGAVLYVLVSGGLLPLAAPPSEQGGKATMFFAGLAFLAGFSERWAQDTIVQSIPKWQASQDEAPPARSGPQPNRYTDDSGQNFGS